MLRLAIVEDEENAAIQLADCISKFCEVNSIHVEIRQFGSATDFLNDYKPVFDIIFMDIMLPNLNGMEAAKQLRLIDDKVTLIFVTNMANFAVKGYDVAALDFIVKPVEYDSFAMKMERAVNAVMQRQGFDLAIQADRSLKRVPASKIYYIEVSRHYLIYHTKEGSIKARGTLDSLEKQLSGGNFVRCNVCYLVNLKYVSEVSGDNLIVGGETLKISRARKKEFMQSLTNYLGKI